MRLPFGQIFLKKYFLKINICSPNQSVWRCVCIYEKKFAKNLFLPINKSYFDPLKKGGSP